MKHPYDEAARIVNLHVPRHILAVDRARLRDAIYQAIVDRYKPDCGVLFGEPLREFRCTRPAGHEGRHVHTAIDKIVIGALPDWDPPRCGARFETPERTEVRCNLPDLHPGPHVRTTQQPHEQPVISEDRCRYIHPDGGRCERVADHGGEHVIGGQMLCGDAGQFGLCNLVRGHAGGHCQL